MMGPGGSRSRSVMMTANPALSSADTSTASNGSVLLLCGTILSLPLIPRSSRAVGAVFTKRPRHSGMRRMGHSHRLFRAFQPGECQIAGQTRKIRRNNAKETKAACQEIGQKPWREGEGKYGEKQGVAA